MTTLASRPIRAIRRRCRQTSCALYQRNRSPEVRALLWDIARLHNIVRRADQLLSCLPASTALDIVISALRRELDGEPCLEEGLRRAQNDWLPTGLRAGSVGAQARGQAPAQSLTCRRQLEWSNDPKAPLRPIMSYDPTDAAMDEMYERIGDELYPEHREQALSEFTAERLQSFYLANPMVMRPAVDAFQEMRKLKDEGHPAAALVFASSAIELFLKATVLHPVVHGLVHTPALAEIIVQVAVSQTGFDRYRSLLARLFAELAEVDLLKVAREGANVALIDECQKVQKLRNDIIHKGTKCQVEDANHAAVVAGAVFQQIVVPMLGALGLTVVEKGRIERS